MATQYQPDLGDRRETDRQRSVFALGKLVCGGREHIAIIRDISPGGLRVEMTDPPAVDTHVVVEMLGLNPTAARVVWRRQGQLGIVFDVPQDVDRMCRRGQDAAGRFARGPRFTIERRARLRVAGKSSVVQMTNISVGGARLTGASVVDPHLPGLLELGLRGAPLSGYVRWVSGDDAGFSFLPPLDMRTLLQTLKT